MRVESMSIDEVVTAAEIENTPQTWRNQWDNFVRWALEGAESQGAVALDNAAEIFGLPAEALPPLAEVYGAIKKQRELTELAWLWHYLIFHAPADIIEYPNGWPTPKALGGLASLFPLTVLASGADHAVQAFQRRGIPVDITKATLAFGGMYVNDYHRRHGEWGLGELGWLVNHVHARIFRLGRLVFKAATYQMPFRVYRCNSTGRLTTLCESKGAYRSDGLANGTNGVTESDAWTPQLVVSENEAQGCLVSTDGIVTRQMITLPLSDWELVLTPGDRIVEVHIPYGGKLWPHDCIAAYAQALEFFPRFYPDDKFTAFTCRSWLMDPGLPRILPTMANIPQFQRHYHQLPVVGTEHQAYDIVFGCRDVDIQTAPRSTLLQRAIGEKVLSGQKMRSSAGYMIWDEAMALVGSSL